MQKLIAFAGHFPFLKTLKNLSFWHAVQDKYFCAKTKNQLHLIVCSLYQSISHNSCRVSESISIV